MDDRVVVAERDNRVDAELLAGTLRGHGIDATVVGDPTMPGAAELGWDTPAQVLVPREDAQEAWDLIHPGDHLVPWSSRTWVRALALLLALALVVPVVLNLFRSS